MVPTINISSDQTLRITNLRNEICDSECLVWIKCLVGLNVYTGHEHFNGVYRVDSHQDHTYLKTIIMYHYKPFYVCSSKESYFEET
jgi:hypothetical protein